MAVYLVEDEVGFDAGTVGFPSLGGCMAFAVVVDNGLFGFHIPPGHKERVGAFLDYCTNGPSRAQWGVIRRLYGSCYWKNRYANADHKFFAWVDEMRYLAGELHYNGGFSGFDTSATQTNIALADATYLEYRLNAATNRCTIHYQNMLRINVTRAVEADTSVRRLTATGQQVVPYLSKVVTDIGGQLMDVTDNFGFYSVE